MPVTRVTVNHEQRATHRKRAGALFLNVPVLSHIAQQPKL
ncbi:hypothetical protein TERTU_0444 [Teredinibacter turnerae T7901]|uniref:Uncharacterized protein n=1 Tax=Teredinibacter turnerae (strain ATCC 39867 / T7901) TaxID=377629 RepID=C5BMV8_TERTT|nr:hypothetical protein TERTU_0444 [Teredinibacter turnerae T7901]